MFGARRGLQLGKRRRRRAITVAAVGNRGGIPLRARRWQPASSVLGRGLRRRPARRASAPCLAAHAAFAGRCVDAASRVAGNDGFARGVAIPAPSLAGSAVFARRQPFSCSQNRLRPPNRSPFVRRTVADRHFGRKKRGVLAEPSLAAMRGGENGPPLAKHRCPPFSARGSPGRLLRPRPLSPRPPPCPARPVRTPAARARLAPSHPSARARLASVPSPLAPAEISARSLWLYTDFTMTR